MAGAILLWIMAAVGAGVTLSAQASGQMLRYRGKRYFGGQDRGPTTIERDKDVEAFRDGLSLRWWAVVVLAVLGAAVAVLHHSGYISG
jgi:hypothetical protein